MCVKGRIESVKILGVKVILRDAQSLAESLVMHDLSLAKELDGIANVGVIYETQNVVVGHPRLLLC